MNRKIKLLALPILTVTGALFFGVSVNAAPVTGFQAGRIIDDVVFTAKDSMNVSQIQTFLNSKVPNCDTNGTQPAGDFGRPDLTHAQYAASRGWPGPPYTCLKDYNGGGRRVSQIIYDTAQKYSINPQVLIVLLQKEQGLVTDTWPLPSQYRSATGYGCPDTAPCDSQYYGITNQLDWSGKMFRAIMDASPTWYTPYVVGNNFIRYSPNSSCGGSNVTIVNRATQALYNYTPYQPNADSLNARYGDAPGDCDSHGNRNFYLYFTDWFGSILGPPYAWSEVSKNLYVDATMTNPISFDSLKTNQYFYIVYKVRNTGSVVWQKNSVLFGKSDSSRSAFCTSDWINCSRPATILEDEVKPGDVGTVAFWMRAPSVSGTYKEYYNLLIENYTWFADIGSYYEIKVSQPTSVPTSLSSSSVRMLKRGDSIYSPDKRSVLNLSLNGELAVYHDRVKKWAVEQTNINDLVLQTDGNLVAYTSSGQVAWSVIGNSNCGTLSMLDSGSLEYSCGSTVLWQTTWTVNTDQGDQLAVGNILQRGQRIASKDGSFILALQSDGNLVLYNNQGQGVWGSNTWSGAFLVQQSDGNLVLYNNQGQGVWGSNRSSANVVTYVQNDGNIVSYSPLRAIWGSKR